MGVRRHPLDPLAAEEIELAADTVRESAEIPRGARFITITLREPVKSIAWEEAAPADHEREAEVVLYDPAKRRTYEVVVGLGSGGVTMVEALDDVQPLITSTEADAAEVAIRADARFASALRRRGVESPTDVMVDIESIGSFAPPAHGEQRLAWGSVWLRESEDEEGYGRPISGVTPIVSLDTMQVLEVEDAEVDPIAPPTETRPSEPGTAPLPPLRELDILQANGPSFELDGNALRWQNWSLRVGFSPREGLVLHTLAFRDGGEPRPVLHRASVSEMVVPYGSPSASHFRKNFFDVGEYGAGLCTCSLELGCDCLGEIRYLDAVVNDGTGAAVPIRNAICIHEEDHGILLKHVDVRSGRSTVARSRRLAISSIATFGNYDYGYFWYLYQDGAIEFEAKLTGMVSTAPLSGPISTRFGTRISESLTAPNHQHFFNVRLDLRVGGERNSVAEVDCVALPPGAENPYGNAFEERARWFERESDARSDLNTTAARTWRIASSERTNALGGQAAYRLVPGANAAPLLAADSGVMRRARFLQHHVWVTPFSEKEMFAAGNYPNQSDTDQGLGRWTAADRPVADRDVVLWYTLGSTHIVRPEDWPIMSVARLGFSLLPDGFFDHNPGEDVGRAETCHR